LHDNAMPTAHLFCPSALGRAHIHADVHSYSHSATSKKDVQKFKDT